MTLNYVTLVLDAYDGQGNVITKGSASFVPSAQLTDAGVEWITEAPVPAVFHAAGTPSVKLLATDNTSPLPTGWTWSVSFSGVPGDPAGFSFFLPYTGGATQYLSDLVPVSPGSGWVSFTGLAPSGDTTGVTDTANIQGLLDLAPAGAVVELQAGIFYTDAPLVLPDVAVMLAGQEGSTQSGAGLPGSGGPIGTCLTPVASWAQGEASAAAVIVGGAGQRHGVQDIWIDGTDTAAIQGVDGINIQGSHGGHSIYRCGVAFMSGWGVYVKAGLGFHADTVITQFNAVNPSSEGVAGGGGYYCGSTDGYHANVHSQTNAGVQIYINSGDNRLFGCRADGVNYTGATAGFFLNCFEGSGNLGIGIMLIGCSTQGNDQQGVICNGGGHNAYGPYQLIGCLFEFDGYNGGSGGLAAIRAIGRVTVSVLGCDISADPTGAWPAYAISTAQNSGTHAVPDLVQADGGGIWQVGTGFVNDAGPATKLVTGASVQGLIGPQNGTTGTTAFVQVAAAKAAPVGYTPASPAGTVSATLVMMGLGSACVYTPSSSGKVLVTVTGYITQATGVSSVTVGPRFGTSTAPSNGDAVTGTRFGTAGDPTLKPPGVGQNTPFSFTALLSLTAGTAYWFDLGLSSGNASDSASMSDIGMTIAEQS